MRNTERTPTPKMDRVYGDYAILADPKNPYEPWVLGEGAFGVTYRAKHRVLREVVALKVLRSDRLGPTEFRRFAREAKALRELSHPNIAAFDYVGMVGEQPYCAMEFCDGGDLQTLSAKKGGLSVRQVLLVGAQVCSALVEAHAKNYVHRDIKPSNLMLKVKGYPTPVVKLIDFGLAGAIDDGLSSRELGIRSTEGFKGTCLYASPELLREEPVDGRSDLYSLGICLWNLALGRKPAELDLTNQAELAQVHLSSVEFDLSGLDDQLRWILEDLVKKSKERRIQTAEEALGRLKESLDSLPAPDEEEGDDLAALLPSDSGSGNWTRRKVSFREHYLEICEMMWESPVGAVYRMIRAEDGGEICAIIVGKFKTDDPETKEIGEERFAFLSELLEEHYRLSQSDDYPRCLIAPREWHWFRDGEIVVECCLTEGIELQECLRRQGRVKFESILPFLWNLAKGMDFLKQHKLPGLALHETQMVVAPTEGGGGMFSSFRGPDLESDWLRCVPKLIPLRFPDDDGSAKMEETVSPSMMGTIIGGGQENAARDPVEALASKVYRWVGGRPVAQAAWITPEGYTSVPGIGAEANQILRMVISGKADRKLTCRGLLIRLCEAEGIDTVAIENREFQMASDAGALVVSPHSANAPASIPLDEENPSFTIVGTPVGPPPLPPKFLPESRPARCTRSAGSQFAWIAGLCLAIFIIATAWGAVKCARTMPSQESKNRKHSEPIPPLVNNGNPTLPSDGGTSGSVSTGSLPPSSSPIAAGMPTQPPTSQSSKSASRAGSPSTPLVEPATSGLADGPHERTPGLETPRPGDDTLPAQSPGNLFGSESRPPLPSTPRERFEAYGVDWIPGNPAHGGNSKWLFRFENGEWVAKSALQEFSSLAARYSQCEMWTQTDRNLKILNPGWAYHPLQNAHVAIRRGMPKEIVYAPSSTEAGAEGNMIWIEFRPGSALFQSTGGQRFEGKVTKNEVISDAYVRQIAAVDAGQSRRHQEGDHLVITLPSGFTVTFVNFYKYH